MEGREIAVALADRYTALGYAAHVQRLPAGEPLLPNAQQAAVVRLTNGRLILVVPESGGRFMSALAAPPSGPRAYDWGWATHSGAVKLEPLQPAVVNGKLPSDAALRKLVAWAESRIDPQEPAGWDIGLPRMKSGGRGRAKSRTASRVQRRAGRR